MSEEKNIKFLIIIWILVLLLNIINLKTTVNTKYEEINKRLENIENHLMGE